MKEILSLQDLGITEEDLGCEVIELDNGEADIHYKVTEEAHAILSAFFPT